MWDVALLYSLNYELPLLDQLFVEHNLFLLDFDKILLLDQKLRKFIQIELVFDDDRVNIIYFTLSVEHGPRRLKQIIQIFLERLHVVYRVLPSLY